MVTQLTKFFLILSVAILMPLSDLKSAEAQEKIDVGKDYSTLIVAGGCFWCVEADFDKVKGVVHTESGYAGGYVANPTYKQVTKGDTGHYEVVRIKYDPKIVSFKELVHYFFRTIDPTDPNGQFCDKGSSYRSAVFVYNDKETAIVREEIKAIDRSNVLGAKVVSMIISGSEFYPAERNHQNYYKKNPLRYRYYRNSCGRDRRVKKLWGKTAKDWHKPIG